MFQNIHGVEYVHDLHGATELGRDLVVVERDALGTRLYTAVVIKAKRFSNATTEVPDRILLTNVFTQIETALVAGFDCHLSGRHEELNKVVVVTSQTVPHAIVTQFNHFIDRHRGISITVKADTDVREWIDAFMPEFYRVSTGHLAVYLSSLAAKCAKLDEHKLLGIYKGEIRDLGEVYVPPRLLRTPTRTTPIGGTRSTRPTAIPVHEGLRQARHMLLVSGPGGGKSTLVRAEVQRLIEVNRRGGVTNVPVVAKAADLSDGLASGANLESVLQALLIDEYGSQAPNLAETLAADRLVTWVLIDGLDEIASYEGQAAVLQAVAEFIDQNREARLVLTSRYADSVKLRIPPQLAEWQLLWGGWRTVRTFSRRWFADEAKHRGFLRTLEDHNLLGKLPNTPLVLTLLAMLYEHGSTSLPAGLAELYQMFTDILLGRWNLRRRVSTFYREAQKEHVLRAFARRLHEGRRLDGPVAEFRVIVEECATELGQTLDPAVMLTDLCDGSGLLVQNEERVRFVHLSFQEFFVATELISRQPDDEYDVVATWFGDPWTAGPTIFYAGSKKRDPRLLRRLLDQIDETVTKSAPETARRTLEMGMIVQASYMTPAVDRLDAVNRSIATYASVLADIVNERDVYPIHPWILTAVLLDLFQKHFRTESWQSLLPALSPEIGDDSMLGLLREILKALMSADNDELGVRLLDLLPRLQQMPSVLKVVEFLTQIALAQDPSAESQHAKTALGRLSAEMREYMRRRPNEFSSSVVEAVGRRAAARFRDAVDRLQKPAPSDLAPGQRS